MTTKTNKGLTKMIRGILNDANLAPIVNYAIDRVLIEFAMDEKTFLKNVAKTNRIRQLTLRKLKSANQLPTLTSTRKRKRDITESYETIGMQMQPIMKQQKTTNNVVINSQIQEPKKVFLKNNEHSEACNSSQLTMKYTINGNLHLKSDAPKLENNSTIKHNNFLYVCTYCEQDFTTKFLKENFNPNRDIFPSSIIDDEISLKLRCIVCEMVFPMDNMF